MKEIMAKRDLPRFGENTDFGWNIFHCYSLCSSQLTYFRMPQFWQAQQIEYLFPEIWFCAFVAGSSTGTRLNMWDLQRF